MPDPGEPGPGRLTREGTAVVSRNPKQDNAKRIANRPHVWDNQVPAPTYLNGAAVVSAIALPDEHSVPRFITLVRGALGEGWELRWVAFQRGYKVLNFVPVASYSEAVMRLITEAERAWHQVSGTGAGEPDDPR